MFRKEFTNKEWNNLNWIPTGFKIGKDGINTCKEVAKKLGYKDTGIEDAYTHTVYEKDGELYFVVIRNNMNVGLAKADFEGEYNRTIYRHKPTGILYAHNAFETSTESGEYKIDEFEIVK